MRQGSFQTGATKMNWKHLFVISLVLFERASPSPTLREVESWLDEFEPEEKIREKRKIDLLQQFENGGIGVRKSLGEDEKEESKNEEEAVPEVPPDPSMTSSSSEDPGIRVKKQTTNNVCIKVGGCGKTACGPVVSARGPVSRLMLHGNQGMIGEERSAGQRPSIESGYNQHMQSRTFDSLLPLSNPLASAFAYTVPTTTSYSADSVPGLAHSFLKPTIAAPVPVAHVEPISLFSHSVPVHSLGSMLLHHPMLNLHRMEVPKISEVIFTPTEVREPPPTYAVKPIPAVPQQIITPQIIPQQVSPYSFPSRYGTAGNAYDGPMICHPYDEKLAQQVIQIRPEVHVVDGAPHQKRLNTSAEDFKSQYSDGAEEDEKKVHEHLRQVNEIREEIMQLNRAAQKIVDQQERLAEMQQRHLWKSEDSMPLGGRMYSPYYASGMYPVPMTSKANALSYPTSADDMEFFLNLLKTGKKIGTMSESFQPSLMSVIDGTKVALGGGNQSAKPGGSEALQSSKMDHHGNGQPNGSKQTSKG